MACERKFQILKARLISTPVLTLPEGTNCFLLYCDAYRVGLGCVLMQHDIVVAYACVFTYSVEDYARIFIFEIVCPHGILLSIISYRVAQFTSRF